jgi:ferric-dicitrate binding protein FerR (iron transport regulator)
MMSDYPSFHTNDFVMDEAFRSWVLDPTVEKDVFWEEYLSRHPQQRKSIEEARVLVQALQVNWHPITERQSMQSFGRLEGKLVNQKTIPLWQRQSLLYRVAAAVTLLLVAFSVWFILNKVNSRITYQTAYGEIKTITLPDQSVVTLNANSKLTLPENWNAASDREVWLEGEAFFEVTHQKNHQKFLVHTADKFAVEVLGTAFNVFKRRSGTWVLLQSGKVKLNIGDNADEETAVVMQPGELVEMQPETGTYTRKKVNPEIASAWTTRRLMFDNTPLSEIVSMLEETYGLQVSVSHPELLQKRVFGSCPTDDIDVLLTAISRPFGLSAKRSGNKVWITSP